MNKKLTLISFALACFQLQAQITITVSDMPNPDDLIRVSASVSTVSTSLTGANITWDYSTLQPELQRVIPVIPPSDFNSPYNFIFNSFNTSYGIKQYTPESIAGFQPQDAYEYFKESNSDYKKIGMGVTINSIPLPMMFSDPDYIYRFPMDYGNEDSSDAYFEMNIPGYGTYAQSIHRVNVVDGWGQLTTPFGTVSALRIKSTVHTRDSVAPSDTSMGNYAFDRPVVYEYKWLSSAGKIPYLQIDATDAGNGETITNITYQDVYHPETPQLNLENTSGNTFSKLYPNPATQQIHLEFSTTETGNVLLVISDLNGKMVNCKTIPVTSTGNQIYTISISDLSSGCYTYSIIGKRVNGSGKLIVQ